MRDQTSRSLKQTTNARKIEIQVNHQLSKQQTGPLKKQVYTTTHFEPETHQMTERKNAEEASPRNMHAIKRARVEIMPETYIYIYI